MSEKETTHHHGSTASLTIGALGVVFGDIGTSPLYALKECLNGPHGVGPEPENVLGLLSLVFWSLTLVVTVKYLTFIMRADNRGEGGILALLALTPRKRLRTLDGNLGWIPLVVIAGAALLYGDGMITPAISVLSAVEGLEVATPSLAHVLPPGFEIKDYVVPITCGILLALFLIQRYGTERVGKLFGPIMLAWFATIGAIGAYHLSKNPSVLAALSPVHAVRFCLAHGFHAFVVLGAVVLAVTGGEALYADMGHFGRRPIRLAWIVLVFPSLVLSYFGMGALVLANKEAAKNPFFAQVPSSPGAVNLPLLALVVLATMAAVIASQALISGAYSLTHSAIHLGFFPRVTIRHTSGKAEGQIYAPEINWILMISCLILVLVFKESSRLAAAYGIAVTGTMGVTSVVYYVVARETWGWSRAKALPLLVLFLSFDLPFLASNTLKFKDGGYVPIAVGVVFFTIMVIWNVGRRHLGDVLRGKSPPLDEFLARLPEPDAAPVSAKSRPDGVIQRVPGTGIYMASNPEGVPPVLIHQTERLHVLPWHVVLLTIRFEHVPHVPESERATVEALGKGFTRVIGRFGFMDRPEVPPLLALAARDPAFGAELVDETFYLGRETFLASDKGKMGALTEGLFAFLSRNSTSATTYFEIPPEKVLELGSQIDL